MSFKIIQCNMYFKNLYIYKRNIQEKYLNKFFGVLLSSRHLMDFYENSEIAKHLGLKVD